MMDKITLCNLALQIAGVSDRISGADENSLEKIVCFDWFDAAADDVMRRYPWRFAAKSATLAQKEPDTTQKEPDVPENKYIPKQDVYPYKYVSTLADDCLVVWEVFGRALFGGTGRKLSDWRVYGANQLLTLEPPTAYIYTVKFSKIPLDDIPLTIAELIAARLAVCIAPPLLRSAEASVHLTQLFNVRLNEAMMIEVSQLRETADFGEGYEQKQSSKQFVCGAERIPPDASGGFMV